MLAKLLQALNIVETHCFAINICFILNDTANICLYCEAKLPVWLGSEDYRLSDSMSKLSDNVRVNKLYTEYFNT